MKDMHAFIKQWTDHRQRMEIARTVGVTTEQQVRNVTKGKSKNFILLQRLIAKAKENMRDAKEAEELAKQITA